MAATLADLRSDVDNLAGLDIEPEERDRLLNEGHVELCVRAEWTRALKEVGPTVADQIAYAYPDARRILSLSVAGNTYAPTDHESVLSLRAGRLVLRTDGVWWLSYESDGTRKISLYPTPGTAGVSILAECVVEPAELVNDADEPAVPSDFRQALVDYVASLTLGRQEDDPEARELHQAEFERQVQRLSELANMQEGDGPIQAQIAGVHF